MSFSKFQQVPVHDPFIKCYDLRANKPLQPITTSPGAALAKFVPSQYASTGQLLVVKANHQFQTIDTATGGANQSFPIPLALAPSAAASTVAVSTTGQVMIIADTSGTLHHYAASLDATFNKQSYATVFADPTPRLPYADVNDFSFSPGFVQYTPPMKGVEPLSSLSADAMARQRIIRRRPQIDPAILANLRISDFIGYSTNRTKLKANRNPYGRDATSLKTPSRLHGGSMVTPGFVRERRKAGGVASSKTSPMKRAPDRMVPKRYRRVEQKYSYLGIEDFDFARYNRTNFCGLEIHIPNAYCNSMLQVLYFLGPVRRLAQQHVSPHEFCLVSELGFLFHMLNQVPGTNCQASNFLRAFRTIPQASGLGLILDVDGAEPDANAMIGKLQAFNRFILAQLEVSTRDTPVNAARVKDHRDGKQENHGAKDKDKGKKGGQAHAASEAQVLFSSKFLVSSTCQVCQNVTKRADDKMVIELEAPAETMKDEALRDYTFGDVLRDSLCKQHYAKAFCKSDCCQDYKTAKHTRRVVELPDVLALNCNADKPNERAFWQRKMDALAPVVSEEPDTDDLVIRGDATAAAGAAGDGGTAEAAAAPASKRGAAPYLDPILGDVPQRTWLPHQIKVKTLMDGDVKVMEVLEAPEAEGATVLEDDEDGTAYELVASVSHINDSVGACNFVSHIKVSQIYHKLKEGISHTAWYLFNDFAVSTAPATSAVTYNLDWKTPVILYYARRGLNELHGCEPKVAIPMEPLMDRMLNDQSLSHVKEAGHVMEPKTEGDVPGAGDVVALDAEFVKLVKEDAEIRSGGVKKSTQKPEHMACARISVVYGSGPNKGKAFIDDYIKMSEPVVDYLTKYSGIKAGDLDPGVSTKHLTTLKNAYSKLLLLELRGVRFIGHGLPKDFRVINMSPPKKSVFDTVDIFGLPQQRKMRLQYLAYKVLGFLMQQSSAGHDSIEDSVTALKLYDYYTDMKALPEKSAWSMRLQRLYDDGRKDGFQVPDNKA